MPQRTSQNRQIFERWAAMANRGTRYSLEGLTKWERAICRVGGTRCLEEEGMSQDWSSTAGLEINWDSLKQVKGLSERLLQENEVGWTPNWIGPCPEGSYTLGREFRNNLVISTTENIVSKFFKKTIINSRKTKGYTRKSNSILHDSAINSIWIIIIKFILTNDLIRMLM